jgi:hypothetical protein
MFKPINFMELENQAHPRQGYGNEEQLSPLVLALLAMLQEKKKEESEKEVPEDYLQYLLRNRDGTSYEPYTPNETPDEMMTRVRREGSGDLMSKLRQRESRGNYGITNSLGYTGAYQFGAPALETVGLLKPGAGKLGNKALKNLANWTLPGGLQEYLSNPVIQDEAMRRLMNANKSTLTKMGLINRHTPEQDVNGMLAAAHLAGPGGVRKMMRGANPRDAYGTGAREYFNLGRSV